jgi:hypothetical protein
MTTLPLIALALALALAVDGKAQGEPCKDNRWLAVPPASPCERPGNINKEERMSCETCVFDSFKGEACATCDSEMGGSNYRPKISLMAALVIEDFEESVGVAFELNPTLEDFYYCRDKEEAEKIAAFINKQIEKVKAHQS